MEKMSTYVKFTKELLTKKIRFLKGNVELEAGCSEKNQVFASQD